MSIMPNALKLVGESTRFSVASCVAMTLIIRHDTATLRWVVGAVVASAANKGLKKIIKQARPGSENNDDDGMPSSHACAMANIGTSVLTNVWLAPTTPPWMPFDRSVVTICLISYFVASVTWRVVVRYHTIPQILVGTVFGIITSLAWRYGCSASGASAYVSTLLDQSEGSIIFAIATVLITGAAVILGKESINFPFLALNYKSKATSEESRGK